MTSGTLQALSLLHSAHPPQALTFSHTEHPLLTDRGVSGWWGTSAVPEYIPKHSAFSDRNGREKVEKWPCDLMVDLMPVIQRGPLFSHSPSSWSFHTLLVFSALIFSCDNLDSRPQPGHHSQACPVSPSLGLVLLSCASDAPFYSWAFITVFYDSLLTGSFTNLHALEGQKPYLSGSLCWHPCWNIIGM